jgi:hypothetical protein
MPEQWQPVQPSHRVASLLAVHDPAAWRNPAGARKRRLLLFLVGLIEPFGFIDAAPFFRLATTGVLRIFQETLHP